MKEERKSTFPIPCPVCSHINKMPAWVSKDDSNGNAINTVYVFTLHGDHCVKCGERFFLKCFTKDKHPCISVGYVLPPLRE